MLLKFYLEFEDEVPADLQDVSSIYKAARKVLEQGIKAIIEGAKRMHLKSGNISIFNSGKYNLSLYLSSKISLIPKLIYR